MPEKKTSRITIRIERWVGDALRDMAEKQDRKPANLAAKALRELVTRAGYAPPNDNERENNVRKSS